MSKIENEELPQNYFDRLGYYIYFMKSFNKIVNGIKSFEIDNSGGFTFEEGETILKNEFAAIKFIEEIGVNGVDDIQVGLRKTSSVDGKYIDNLAEYISKMKQKIIFEYQKRGNLTSFQPIVDDIYAKKLKIPVFNNKSIENIR